MSYAEPTVEVLTALREHEVLRTTLRIIQGSVGEPLAPAALYSVNAPNEERLQLHKLIDRTGSRWSFETFRVVSDVLRSPGEIFVFRPWWVPPAMDAALDTQAKWQHRIYPANGDHDHCLFTWETIAADSDIKEGYWSERHGWITVKAYEDIIKNDVYRLRCGSKDA